jgi:Asp-tRNA(Asn)/Glu-tRNA(Gln) amidotransferase A subunit family amidase
VCYDQPMTDLAFTSAADLARLIADRTLSPVELVDVVLDRIERAQPVLRAAALLEMARPWADRTPPPTW